MQSEVVKIARYTISLNGAFEEMLNSFMKENNIKLKSVAIKKCVEIATDNNEYKSFLYELDSKLNRILFRQNLNKKILEQLFVNMGFLNNERIEKDNCLKDVYDDYREKYFKRGESNE